MPSRRVAAATLYRIAASHAGGLHESPSRARAVAELRSVSTDPDMLAEAAAAHAVSDNWYAVTAVDLLIEAGADQALIEEHLGDAWSHHHHDFDHDERRQAG